MTDEGLVWEFLSLVVSQKGILHMRVGAKGRGVFEAD